MNRPPRTKREHLRQLVTAKKQWSGPLADDAQDHGFLGWHERGYLPHCDKPGLAQLVTFRLKDSMPASRRGEWEHLLDIEDEVVKRTKLESYLDRGLGNCVLRDARVASCVEEAMVHYHGQRFSLLAWAIMPNHVHVLVEVWTTPLSKIIQNWKSISATDANKLLKREGRFWQPEYWDRFMRDKEQTGKAIRYIENNPVKAGLCRAPEEWPLSSARFRDAQTGQLILPGR